MANGYRSENRYTVFQCLTHTLGWPAHRWRVLDAAHRKRNLAEYEGFVEFEESAIEERRVLAADLIADVGMSSYRLAKEIGVPAQRIGEILAGKRAITADTDLWLCRFGLSDGWWLRLQADYDTEIAKKTLARTQAKIKPWAKTAEDATRT